MKLQDGEGRSSSQKGMMRCLGRTRITGNCTVRSEAKLLEMCLIIASMLGVEGEDKGLIEQQFPASAPKTALLSGLPKPSPPHSSIEMRIG